VTILEFVQNGHFLSTVCLPKNEELFLLKIFISKYIRKPRYKLYPDRSMEVQIPARIGLSPSVVKFGLFWHKMADL
jgi:hypothetical protein